MANSTYQVGSTDALVAGCPTHKHGICWASVLAGAVAALAVSFALFLGAASLGLAVASPWSGEGASAGAIGAGAIIAMIIVQWLSSAFGGYLAGRLRTSWRVHTDEVCFRDTAHGFLTWAVATIAMIVLFSTAATSVVGGGAKAATAGTAVAASKDAPMQNDSFGYYIDAMFRSGKASTDSSAPETRAEVGRIFAKSMTDEGITAEDKSYVAQVVANRTGVSAAEAERRIDTAVTNIKKAADDARKAAAKLSIYTFLSLAIGAFIAAVAGALGGRCRDEVQPLV